MSKNMSKKAFYPSFYLILYVAIFSSCLWTKASFALISENIPNYQLVTKKIDKDLLQRSHLDFVNKNSVTYHYEQVQIGERAYRLGVFEHSPVGNLRYLVVHDSENASFDSGLQTLVNHGGRMVVLENAEKRGLFDQISQKNTEIDPNRIFGYQDSKTLEAQSSYLFSQYILEKLNLNRDSIVLALHNNSRYGRFGMNNLAELGDMTVNCHHDAEQKNLFWFTQSNTKNFDKNQLVNNLCAVQQFNVVTENVGEVSDKSLSNFSHFYGIDYINIEIKMAKNGNAKSEYDAKMAQIRYINALLKQLKTLKQP